MMTEALTFLAIVVLFLCLFVAGIIGTTIAVALQAVMNNQNPFRTVAAWWADIL